MLNWCMNFSPSQTARLLLLRKLNLWMGAAGRMHGLKSDSCRIWQRTDLPPGLNMLRTEIQRALRRAPRQLRGLRLGLQTRRGSNHSTAHVGESNSRSNVFQIRRESVCVPSRWKVLSGEFRRRPTALAIKISQTRSCRSPRTV